MHPLEEMEMAVLAYGLGQEEMDEALEYAFICLIDSDATLLEEIRLLTTEGDPKKENGRVWVPNKNDLY